MKKRILALLLAGALALGLAACRNTEKPQQGTNDTPKTQAASIAKEDLKAGLLLAGEDADAYDANHMDGMGKACQALGLDADAQVLVKTNLQEDADCAAAIQELVEAGCQILFSDSAGHEAAMAAAAQEFPAVQFCTAAGGQSAADSLDNTHNYFAEIYQARYLAGIAAGRKTQTNKLGYVAAKPCAEVISGFTAFYLGAKSANSAVEMYVNYTNAWSDAGKEATNAQALIDQGCDVISQHTNTAAPVTTAEQNGVWAVGYNDDMTMAAPLAALCSARINWGVYYEYALDCLLNGEAIAQDWWGGLAEGAVYLSDLNEAVVAGGTAEAIQTAEAGLKAGTLPVFAGPLTGTNAGGETIDLAKGEQFPENEKASAPSWDYIIPGINVLP